MIEHVYDGLMESMAGRTSDGSVAAIDLDAELADVAGQLNLANARLVRLAEHAVASGEWESSGLRSPAQFLAHRAGLSPERAKLVVDVAERRSEFPVIVGAFERGELSLEQVVEVVKAPAWADAQLLDMATISTVGKLRRGMRSKHFEGDPDEPDPEPAPPRDRVSFGIGRNGRWRLNAELGVDEGRRIEAALTERKDALFTDGDADVTWPEALVDCFDRSLGSVSSVARRDHYRTWIHLDVTSGDATTTDGWRIPMAVEQHLLCDGVVQPVWEREGVPFSVGRSQRIVPDRTRRIVERRDRGCRVPGCTADRFVEIHHIVHWLDGGATDTCNLVSLCPRHHKLHHQGVIGIRGDADEFDALVFTTADGKGIPGSGRARPATADPPTPIKPYEPPLQGRFDWTWIGLGWVHPKVRAARRERWRDLDAA